MYDFQVYGKVLTDAQVKALLAAGLGDTTDTPSSTLPTPRYKLEAQKTFVPANKECIDTGIKPFATIDTGMNLTVYATFTVADSAVNTVTTLLDCFTDSTDDRRGIIVATWTNGTVGVNVFTYASHFVKIESGKKMKFLLQIKGTQFREVPVLRFHDRMEEYPELCCEQDGGAAAAPRCGLGETARQRTGSSMARFMISGYLTRR